jgi:hypothetical protein
MTGNGLHPAKIADVYPDRSGVNGMPLRSGSVKAVISEFSRKSHCDPPNAAAGMALRAMMAFSFSNGTEQYILADRREALAAAGDVPGCHDRPRPGKDKAAVMMSSLSLVLQLTQGRHLKRLGNERI